jgi:hypothetical protein
MKEEIEATQIKSTADARKLAPFVDENKIPYIWVNWSRPHEITGKKTRPHFRKYPLKSRNKNASKILLKSEIEEKKQKSESLIHKKSRLMLTEFLQSQVNNGKELIWAFKDERVSNFPITGNLLSMVTKVETHYKYKTPFDFEYEFDIALIGEYASGQSFPLGAIELEYTHKFGISKLLITKCLGFPLLSIDISNYSIDDINLDWCKKVINETTKSSEDSLRRNYVYIHNSLYPVYVNLPRHYREEPIQTDLGFEERTHQKTNSLKHQYVVFCKEEQHEKFHHTIRRYKEILGLSDKDVLIQPNKINYDNEQSLKAARNEGSIAGHNWADFNSHRYFRIIMKVPTKKTGDLYLFHLILARLCNAHFETLSGYKYKKGISNRNIDNEFWYSNEVKLIQKQISEPVKYILEYIDEIDELREIENANDDSDIQL